MGSYSQSLGQWESQYQYRLADPGYLMDHNYGSWMGVGAQCVELANCEVSVVDEDTDSGVVMTDEPDLQKKVPFAIQRKSPEGLPFVAVIGRLKTELRNTQLRLEEAQELAQRKDGRLFIQDEKLEEYKREILELKREREEMKEKLEGGRRDYADSLQKLRMDEHLHRLRVVSSCKTVQDEFQNEQRRRRELEVENFRLKHRLRMKFQGNGCGVEEVTSTSGNRALEANQGLIIEHVPNLQVVTPQKQEDPDDDIMIVEEVIKTPKAIKAGEPQPGTSRDLVAVPPVERAVALSGTKPCTMCPAVLKDSWELKMHVWEQHQLARAPLALPPARSHQAIGGIRKLSPENQARPLPPPVNCNKKLPFTCSVCQEGFTRVSQLRKHRARKHSISYHGFTIGCSKCGITFTSRKAHARHRKTVHAPRSKSANTTKEVSLQLARFEDPRPFVQDLLDVDEEGETITVPILTVPSVLPVLEPVPCKDDSQTTGGSEVAESMPQLTAEVSRTMPRREEEEEETQELEILPEEEYQRHVPVGTNSKGEYLCSCGVAYELKRSLSTHCQLKSIGKIFQCEWCTTRFDTHRGLKSHVESVHDATYGDGRFACGKCSRTFFIWKDLLKHRKVHQMK